MTGVSKGLVGMVTKPVGGAAEFVANAGEGFLTGAGWILSPKRLDSSSTQVMRSDTRIRLFYYLYSYLRLYFFNILKYTFFNCSISRFPKISLWFRYPFLDRC